jgi:hypothetical protein
VNRPKLALAQGAGLLCALGALSSLVIAAPDAKARATGVLSALKKSPETARVASASIAKAEDALKRAEQMRSTGDQKHGAMLEETALEWATASELLGKAAQAERRLNELQTKATELETRVFRAQALVEQTVARRARAEEALRQLNEKGGSKP